MPLSLAPEAAPKVLRFSIEQPDITRAQAGRLAGLDKAVASRLFKDLLSKGLLAEGDYVSRKGEAQGGNSRAIYPTETFWMLHSTTKDTVLSELSDPLRTIYDEALIYRHKIAERAATIPLSFLIRDPTEKLASYQDRRSYLGAIALLAEENDLSHIPDWYPGQEGWKLLVTGVLYSPFQDDSS